MKLSLKLVILRDVIISLLLCTNSFAISALPSIDEVLKNIPTSSGVCLKDDVPSESQLQSKEEYEKPDMSCAIQGADAMLLMRKANSVVIDTRQKNITDSNLINGALIMSPTELRSKFYLKNKQIFLVGDGRSEVGLYTACGQLKKNGFIDVKVVRGGLPSLLLIDNLVDIQRNNILDIQKLTPIELFNESRFAANQVVIASSRQGMKKHFPLAVEVTGDDVSSIKSAIRKNKKLNGISSSAVIIIGSADEIELKKIITGIFPIPVLFFVESEKNYLTALEQQKLTWSAQDHGPKKLGCGL